MYYENTGDSANAVFSSSSVPVIGYYLTMVQETKQME